MNKLVRTEELFSSVPYYLTDLFSRCEYPWEMLPKIKGYVQALIRQGIPGFREIAPGVMVGEDVKIHHSATIEGPTIIGSGSEVRPGAYLRGCNIF